MPASGLTIVLALSAALAASPAGSDETASATPPTASAFDHDHQRLTELLELHVRDGLVNYRGLRQQRPVLQKYLAEIGDLAPEAYALMTPQQRLALLINAHNAFTLELVLEHYPLASVRDVPEARTARRWRLAGATVSLDDIELELIRREFPDARIHAALVDAARGCPPLRREAYRPHHLDNQLEDQCRTWVRDKRWNRITVWSRQVFVTRIFDWYGEDFVPQWGEADVRSYEVGSKQKAILGFLAHFMTPEAAEIMRRHEVALDFLEFDWSLNETR